MRGLTPRSVTALVVAFSVVSLSPLEAGLSSKEWSSLSKRVRRAAKMGDGATLSRLIPEVAADDSDRAVDLIASVVSKVQDPDVFSASRDALAGITDEKAVGKMIKKLSKGSGPWPFRVVLADAFARRGDEASLEALGEALSDRRKEVVRASIDAILSRRDKGSIEALISALEVAEKKRQEGLVPNKLRETLRALTGEDFDNAYGYRGWWDARRGSFEVPAEGAVVKRKVEGTVDKKPKFFGSEIKSRAVVFVIDVSGSMQASDPERAGGGGADRPETGPGAGGKEAPKAPSRVRVERAKFQLARAIKSLPKNSKFTVIAYSGAAIMGQLPKKNDPIQPKVGNLQWLNVWNKKLVLAGSKQVKGALDFVGKFKAEGGTFTYRAIKTAFKISEADNIILLSDGAPNDPDGTRSMTTDEILKEVSTLNNFRKLRIDTFGFDMGGGLARGRTGQAPANPFVEFLKKLAKENGGKYTPIN
jgi:hypothetical protein